MIGDLGHDGFPKAAHTDRRYDINELVHGPRQLNPRVMLVRGHKGRAGGRGVAHRLGTDGDRFWRGNRANWHAVNPGYHLSSSAEAGRRGALSGSTGDLEKARPFACLVDVAAGSFRFRLGFIFARAFPNTSSSRIHRLLERNERC